MGLKILHPEQDQAVDKAIAVDVVAVHGLNGDATDTWTDTKTKAFWLKDFLPSDLLGARIVSFNNNADAGFCNTIADVPDHARDLLGSLIDEREAENVSFAAPLITDRASDL